MGSDMQELLGVFGVLAGVGVGITLLVLFIIYVAVPLFRGVGAGIGWIFHAIGWFFSHIFEFIFGVFRDLIRFVGALIAMVVLMPLVPLNIIIGRWSAAGHFGEGVKRECQVGSACVYRALIRRPLKLVLLDGLLEGLEQRVPEAMHGAPTSDKPSRRVGQFDGYTIIGSLRAGGSGAKLYVAEPTPEKRAKIRHVPHRVVIKSFALTEGSSLPQIVRESRALECAKQLGHVLDHGMDEHRFFYVMPYHPGDHLGIITRQLHGESGGRGLDQKRLNLVMSHTRDLLATLSAYHKGGLWHKDVKPENVIVHDGRAHLVDLGLVTPLRSAMTLTTHGTEYFRDPEMVRQALRGVKVHQVNGAKFDIYAAGAVLYFMIENTFPAHGGLSRFAARSPEALRWIVRRAMTEYHQRYSSADEMLADLEYVLSAGDAFAVKPAELPSMRGELEIAPAEAEAEVVAVAHAPAPPKPVALHGYGVAAGFGGPHGNFAQIGEFNLDEDGKPIKPNPSTSVRPRLSITNWWTGEYRPDGNVEEVSARDLRKEAFAFRQQAETIGRQARTGMISARKAAREQIKAARQRAKELRARALAHRHKVAAPHSRTPVSTIVIGTLSVLFLGAILSAALLNRGGPSHHVRMASSDGQSVPVLFTIDSSVPLTSTLRNQIKRIAEDYRRRGYEIREESSEAISAQFPSYAEWKSNPTKAEESFENYLDSHNAWGLVRVTVDHSRNSRRPHITSNFITSTRPITELRQRIEAEKIPPAPPHPYLVVNDHPTKMDPPVSAEIMKRLSQYRAHGWKLVEYVDDVEASVRKVMPIGPIEPDQAYSPELHAVLAEHELGGVLRIDGKVGPEPVFQRVKVSRIDRDYSLKFLPDAPSTADIETPEPPQVADRSR